MQKTYNARLVKNLGEVTSANNGESIIFGLRLGEPSSDLYEDEYFAIDHASLTLLIAGLVDGGDKAETLREKNPVHAGTGGGFAFKLERASIGPSLKHLGEHILEAEVRGSEGGLLKYRIRAGRTELENLCDLIDLYLDSPEGRGQQLPGTH